MTIKIYSDDNSYKICVHTRVGDFTGFGESIVEEVSDAITRILIILKSHMVYYLVWIYYSISQAKKQILFDSSRRTESNGTTLPVQKCLSAEI